MSDKKIEVDILNEVAKIVFTSKYARYNEKLKRRETWEEATSRVEAMHLKRFARLTPEQKEEIKAAFDLVRKKIVCPSMRSMQFGGKAMESINLRGYNCTVRHIDSLRSFAEVFYASLCGCGVGIGLSNFFMNRLPDLVNHNDKTGTVLTYVVEDTIAGWSDSLEALMSCYFKNTAYSGRKIVFDYSKIRRKGTRLKTSGGKAPGYVPLKAALAKIKHLLDSIIEKKNQTRMKTIDAYDILMHSVDAVLSGGIRRSATCVIFLKDDMDMMKAKSGNWNEENKQRARSNNSVLLLRNKTTKAEFESIFEFTKQYGEPGVVWADDEKMLFNPCFSIDTQILTSDGWRDFEYLLGKEVDIIQDSRIKGRLNEQSQREEWFFTGKDGVEVNKASNIRQTAKNVEIFELEMDCGRKVKATSNHLFATPSGMVELGKLKKNDKILIPTNTLFSPNNKNADFIEGYLAGLIYGDGCVTESAAIIDLWENDKKRVSHIEKLVHSFCLDDLDSQQTHKTLPTFSKCIEKETYTKYRLCSASLLRKLSRKNFSKDDLKWLHFTSKNYKCGFLSGLFYADGHVESGKKSRLSLRITSVKKDDLVELSLILQELGILARVKKLLPERKTLLPNGKGGVSEYLCQPSFRLIISGKDNCSNCSKILFYNTDKKQIFEKALKNVKSGYKISKTSKVLSIESIGKQDVYCLSENNNRTLVANGLTARRCFEISFIPMTEDGQCGMQMCNLTTVNGNLIENEAKLKEAVAAEALIGTLQASYTDFPYLGKVAEKLTREESLLGCSITSMFVNPKLLLDAKIQEKMAAVAVETNKKWAEIIGINQAARVTAIKPEGTGTKALGSLFSGIHPAHSEKQLLLIQMNKQENIYQFFKAYNPDFCQESVWDPNKETDVITFPIQNPKGAIYKGDLSAIEHLKYIKSTQLHWVNQGTTKANKKPITHNVSATIIVKDNEWNEVIDYVYANRFDFAGLSFLSDTGDKKYKQAPNQTVKTKEEIEAFNKMVENFSSVDYTKLEEGDDETHLQQEISCAGGVCEIV